MNIENVIELDGFVWKEVKRLQKKSRFITGYPSTIKVTVDTLILSGIDKFDNALDEFALQSNNCEKEMKEIV